MSRKVGHVEWEEKIHAFGHFFREKGMHHSVGTSNQP